MSNPEYRSISQILAVKPRQSRGQGAKNLRLNRPWLVCPPSPVAVLDGPLLATCRISESQA
jgi:hypothetical protein